MASPSSPPAASSKGRPRRRRQRSVRVTVAVVLLSVATLGVVLAVPTQSPVWLSIAAVVTVLFAWASARIVYTELVQSRREAAADRAAQAKAYRSLFTERASEHAEFTSAMTDRLADHAREVDELSGSLAETARRAAEAEARVQKEARRATEAEHRVAALSEVLDVRAAERADELATWDGSVVEELMSWEQKVAEATSPDPQAEPKVG